MDIREIVLQAAALIGAYLAVAAGAAAQKIGEAFGEKAVRAAENLLHLIRRKFAADGDAYAQETLRRLEAQPTSEARQAALADVLAEKAETDPDFARELAGLVQAAFRGETTVQFLTQVYGEARVSKIVNIGQAGIVQVD
ncbi:MAG: hypothetical protein N0A03_09045 [Anaerolineae bacterium]|nr:hypothetical protein [Anaerolineae bacterium]